MAYRSKAIRGRAEPVVAAMPRGTDGVALAFVRLSVLPAVALLAWLLVAMPLLLIDALRPLPAVALFAPAMVVLGTVTWRLTGRAAPHAVPGPVPRWTLWALLAVGAAFVLGNGLLHAEKVIIRRDAASYSQIGHWLAQHGSLTVPSRLDAFGGPDPLLLVNSPAFYGTGETLTPQFMSGLPATLAAAEWMTSWETTLWLPAVFGGLGLLAFGGLVARLVGAGWAPFGALVLGLAEPFWHVARATFSEPLAVLLLLGGLCLLVDAVRRQDRTAALLGGLAIGICTVVRVDGLREVMLLVPIAGWFALRGDLARLWRPLAGGLAVGLAYGVIDGALLTLPYIRALEGSLRPLAWLFALTVLGTVAAVRLAPVTRRRLAVPRWVPAAGGWLVVVAAVAFAVRPLAQTVHGLPPDSGGAQFVARLQEREGLAVDGTRTYDEWSLHWLTWWLGWPLIVLGVAGAAVLVRRMLQGRDREWVAPLAVILGSLALILWRPGITPDHPWADRRFVPIALPGLVLLAGFAIRWLRDHLRADPLRGLDRSPRWAVGVAVAGILAPILWTSVPLLPDRIERGSLDAIRSVCAALQPDDAVLLVDPRARLELPSALRGECGVPAIGVRDTDPAGLSEIIEKTEQTGHRPVLMSANSQEPITQLGVEPVQIVDVTTRTDRERLMGVPTSDRTLTVTVWLGRP